MVKNYSYYGDELFLYAKKTHFLLLNAILMEIFFFVMAVFCSSKGGLFESLAIRE